MEASSGMAGMSAGLGVKALSFLCQNMSGDAGPLCLPYDYNSTDVDENVGQLMERIVSIVVPLLFSIIVVVGLIGNALVSTGYRASPPNNLSIPLTLVSQHVNNKLKHQSTRKLRTLTFSI